MKSMRLKKFLFATGGLFAFQVAGCNILEQFQEWFPTFPGLGG